ncbi:TIGR02234 family membrane protein [Streptomyces sp. NPDC047968]|uniref:TIGR02234 family membrane protein n=1 Tax=unclassified Streptomyces TaxID=2593676 RepID=UPI0034326BA2
MGGVSALPPVPPPRAEAAPDAPAAPATGGARRSLAAALLLGSAGSTAVLLASGRIWAEGRAEVGGGTVALEATGSDVTGVPSALAVVALAALVALFAVRRGGRLLVSALLALSGAGTVAAALLGSSDRAALDEAAARTTGDAAAAVDGLTHTAWPLAAAAGGLLILLAGVLALRFGARWPAMSGRYERDGTPRRRPAPAAVDPDRPEDLWKALDRGEDPTREA